MPRVLFLVLTALLAAGCVAQPDESAPPVADPALPACASAFVNVQWEDAAGATADELRAAFEEAGYAWIEPQPGVAEVRTPGANVTTRLALPADATEPSSVLTLTVRGAAGATDEETVLAQARGIAAIVNATAPEAELRQWLVDVTDAGCGLAGAGDRDAGFDATADR